MSDLAMTVVEIRAEFLAQAPEAHARDWHRSDGVALMGIVALEEVVPFAFTHPDTTSEAAAHIGRLLTAYRATLPFDEAERGWIVEMGVTLPTDEAVEEIRGNEAVLMSRGLRRAVVGDELLGRWVAWRRGIDEFRGQETVAEACQVLERICESALPEWRRVT